MITLTDTILAIGSVAGAVVTICALVTLIIKPLRKAFVAWVLKTTDRDSINQKLDHLSDLIRTAIAQNDELQAEMAKQSKALQAGLRDSILNLYNRCIAKNYITSFELQNLSELYENYTALDGNSFIKQCVDRLKSLDIRNE